MTGERDDARRRRRRTAIAVTVLAVVSAGVATALAVGPLSPPPSLAVFDREPTARERELEQREPAEGGIIAPGAVAEARVILDVALANGRTVLEVWALRSEVTDDPGGDRTIICLTTSPTGANGNDLFSCMDQRDVERRGFIPLDQPRPRIVVDGELRVIEWGPTGDARLIDPPRPPRRSGAGS